MEDVSFPLQFIEKNFDTELLFTDTGSLCGKICFDFSNYSKDSKVFNETNKKVIGKMKDEFGGVIVNEFVGLKSKMHSIKKLDGKECNTAKGVSIATEFDKFKDVLFDEKLLDTK